MRGARSPRGAGERSQRGARLGGRKRIERVDGKTELREREPRYLNGQPARPADRGRLEPLSSCDSINSRIASASGKPNRTASRRRSHRTSYSSTRADARRWVIAGSGSRRAGQLGTPSHPRRPLGCRAPAPAAQVARAASSSAPTHTLAGRESRRSRSPARGPLARTGSTPGSGRAAAGRRQRPCRAPSRDDRARRQRAACRVDRHVPGVDD